MACKLGRTRAGNEAAMVLLLASLLFQAATAATALSAVTPLQKVLQMMKRMKATGIEERDAEAVRMGAFRQFCQDTAGVKSKAIEKSVREIELRQATISQADSDIAKLAKAIAVHDEDIANNKKDEQAASEVRQQEHADFISTQDDYQSSLDALDRAVQVLKSLPQDVSQQQEALLQLPLARVAASPRTPASVQAAVQALLQERAHTLQDPLLFHSAPEAHAYEAQSGGVMEMLKELRLRLQQELTDLDKEETSARHAYEQLVEKLTGETQLAEQGIARRSKEKAKAEEEKALAHGELQELTTVKAEDEKYLSDLTSLCQQKASDFDARQQLRAEEIESLSKAIEIISAVTETPARAAEATSLAQMLRAPASYGSDDQGLQQALALLRKHAAKPGNTELAALVQKAGDDKFAKVKDMIKTLLVKLMEEANTEANHKAWCDGELGENTATKKVKQAAVDELAAEAERLSAAIAQLSQDIEESAEEITEIEKSVAEAKVERQKEHDANEATIAEAKANQAAVAEALAVLRDFYSKAAAATSFVEQDPAEDAPDTFEEAYKGQQIESGNVISFLEVIESEFAKVQVSTEGSERAALDAFNSFVADAKKDKAVKGQEKSHNEDRLQKSQAKLKATEASLGRTHEELAAAQQYFEKLKSTCLDVKVSYEERVARRKEEIETLKQAHEILESNPLRSLALDRSDE